MSQPQAFLLLSNLPGENKLKTLKYFLSKSDNIIGTDPKCHICLHEKYSNITHIANLRIQYNFYSLEAFHNNQVYIESNVQRQSKDCDNYFPLQRKITYLPKMQSYFYIGRIKAIIGTNYSKQQLFNLKNVENRHLYNSKKEQSKKKNVQIQKCMNNIQEIKQIHNKNSLVDRNNQSEQILLEKYLIKDEKQKTQNFQIDFVSKDALNIEVEQQKQEIKSNNTQVIEEIQQTLEINDLYFMNEATLVIQNQIEATQKIEDNENKKQISEESFQMPPTIVDQNPVIHKKNERDQEKQIHLDEEKNIDNHKEEQKKPLKEEQQQKQVQDFEDLFNKQQKSLKKSRDSKAAGIFFSSRKMQKTEKKQQSKIKVNIMGFKPTPAHKNSLREKGYEIVENPNDEDYEILIMKEPIRVSNKLLKALILGKSIFNQKWILQDIPELQGKINGIQWSQIYEKRGNHKNLLKKRGRIYISNHLKELFQGVVQKCGGEKTKDLADRKRVLNIFLKVQEPSDKSLFEKNKDQSKKWRFMPTEILVNAILLAEFKPQQQDFIEFEKIK